MNAVEFEKLLDRIVVDTRKKLLQAIDDSAPYGPRDDRSAIRRTFNGCCGLAQCIAGYFFQDIGVQVRAIATQSLLGWYRGHATLSVVLPDPAGDHLYLVDPTFVQFCGGQDATTPGPPMLSASGAPELGHTLARRGFVELTPEIAAAYLSFFCDGSMPFNSAEECLAFCKDPPAHAYHFNAGDGTNRFSRAALDRQNLILSSPSPQ